MKKTIFTLILTLVTMSSTVFAQSNKEEVDLMQSVFGMEKKAMVAEFIQLDGNKNDVFWTIYDEYEVKRKELGQRRLTLLNNYANSYNTLDETATGNILNEMMQLQVNTDRLIGTYARKIKKKVDVKTAAQFYQIEGYILSKIRVSILENIPVIGEMDGN